MTGQPDASVLRDLALDIAREAGALIASRRAVGVRVADTKTSITDIVTEADRDSEDLIRERVLAARPDDGFLGEEGGDVTGTSGLRWIADPIDGTVNYLYDLPNYCVSLAVARSDGGHEEVVAGVVVNPVTGDEYAAARSEGATRNGLPIRVRPSVEWPRALVSTGFNYEPAIRRRQAVSVAALLGEVADIRRFGSCALDLCAVAAGLSDGYVEEGVKLWDHAAAGLIAAEAGARVELHTGASGRTLVMAAGAAGFEGFEAVVRRCGFVSSGT